MRILLIVYFRVLSAITSKFAECRFFSQISTALKMNNLTPHWYCLILTAKNKLTTSRHANSQRMESPLLPSNFLALDAPH